MLSDNRHVHLDDTLSKHLTIQGAPSPSRTRTCRGTIEKSIRGYSARGQASHAWPRIAHTFRQNPRAI